MQQRIHISFLGCVLYSKQLSKTILLFSKVPHIIIVIIIVFTIIIIDISIIIIITTYEKHKTLVGILPNTLFLVITESHQMTKTILSTVSFRWKYQVLM